MRMDTSIMQSSKKHVTRVVGESSELSLHEKAKKLDLTPPKPLLKYEWGSYDSRAQELKLNCTILYLNNGLGRLTVRKLSDDSKMRVPYVSIDEHVYEVEPMPANVRDEDRHGYHDFDVRMLVADLKSAQFLMLDSFYRHDNHDEAPENGQYQRLKLYGKHTHEVVMKNLAFPDDISEREILH